MTRLFNINGAALLLLVVALVVATWPFFGTFTVATVIVGLFAAAAMQSWHRQHPSSVALPDRRLRSEINLSSIPVRDDAGGLLFALASMGILLGLPQLRWFMMASLLCAAMVAVMLIVWRRHARVRRAA